MNPSNFRFVAGGERGRLLEFARQRGERSFTLGEAVREADLSASRELMVVAEGLVRDGSLRKCGPIQFKYVPPPPAPEEPLVVAEPVMPAPKPDAPLRASLPRTEVEKAATPAPPPAPRAEVRIPAPTQTCECGATFTPSNPRQAYCSERCRKRSEQRRAHARAIEAAAQRASAPPQSIGDQIRALPIDGRPGRPPRPAKEKPMATSPLDRLVDVRARKDKLADELDALVHEESELVAAIRKVIGEDVVPVPAEPRRKARAKPVRAAPRAKKPTGVGGRKPSVLRDLVLAAARKKPIRADDVDAGDVRLTTVRQIMRRMEAEGQLRKVQRGLYEAA